MKISESTIKLPGFISLEGNSSFIITLLIMIILPLHYQYLPPFLILLCFVRIIEAFSMRNPDAKFKTHSLILCGLFIVFFFWQLVTVIYSEDSTLAWSNVFGRMSLLLFPLAYFNPAKKISEQKFFLIRIFSIAVCLYLLFCYGNAFSRALTMQEGKLIFNPHPPGSEWLNYFYELEFTNSIHPSYLSMYVLLSALISFEAFYYFDKKWALQIFWLILAVFLLGSLYFISSRAGILGAIIIVPVYFIVKLITVKRFRLFWFFFLIVMIIPLLFVKGNEKVDSLINNFSQKGYTMQDDRLLIWKSAISRIKEDPLLGVGIGDVRTELIKVYEKDGKMDIATQRLNAHNQFLETMLEGGIIETLILVAIFIFMFYVSIRQKNILFGLYVVMMIIFFMFETTLYRLAGVAFFSLFSFILPLQMKNS